MPTLAQALAGTAFVSSKVRPGIARRVSPLGPMLNTDHDEKLPKAAPIRAKREARDKPPEVPREVIPPAPPADPEPPKQEDPMPRGVYDRSKVKRATKGGEPGEGDAPVRKPAPPKKGKKRKSPAKASPAKATRPVEGRRFGVFDDGSIVVNLPGCSGELSADDAAALVAFIQGRRGK